ncbi:MAG: pitrilysin family protein [Acutalibacteraceae bacterium]|nr:insulinase family protein [Clostridia bacterium]MEE3451007.1 pitrilysin family protein [Acutalibacteraceae bacterium]
MNIKKVESSLVKESYYVIDHPSGLTIYVHPKEGYRSAYAIFGTNYGSVNTKFRVDGGDIISVPDGIAHYLEHKLFESEEGDAFVRYAATGADANAYTSFEKTCYLFSCTDKFEESLEILLDFVQSPYFTEQTVAKEQGIIGQEIKMYEDSPDWRVMFNTLVGMYHKHPVRIDIAGTVESIAEITAEKLYDCYNSFYNLHNMVLCVAGNTTPEQVIAVADRVLKTDKDQKVENIFEDEPYEVASEYIEQKFPVSIPMFTLGFKQDASNGAKTSKELAYMNILMDIFSSSSSKLYNELLNEGLINDTFSYEYMEGPGYAAILFGGESRKPKEAAARIKESIVKFKEKGIDTEEFDIAKRAVYGTAIRSFNSSDKIANNMVDMHFNNRELFEYIEAVAGAKVSDIEKSLEQMLDPDNCTLSVVCSEEQSV